MEPPKMILGSINQLTTYDLPKLKVVIRELILAIDEEDRFKRADKAAGLICEALGVKEPVRFDEYPHCG